MSRFIELHPGGMRDARWLVNIDAISMVKRINTGGAIIVIRQASTVREIEVVESYDDMLAMLDAFSRTGR